MTVGHTAIPLGGHPLRGIPEVRSEPALWLHSLLNGTPYPLSPEARDFSHRERRYLPETHRSVAQNEGGPEPIQIYFDQPKAFKAA